MSIGVSVGKKIKILKHCIECICTLLRWIYTDCSDGPLSFAVVAIDWAVGHRAEPAAKQPYPAGLRCPPNVRDPDRGAQCRDVIVNEL